MLTAQFDALRDAAETDGGVQFEGLSVRLAADGYLFDTPARSETGLSADELREVAAESEHVTNWYFWERTVGRGGVHRRRFLRFLERADDRAVDARYAALRDGVTTEWGQLLLTASLAERGERTYEVRHVDDADADRGALDVRDDPRDARDIGTYDPKGRYRPLKTAPSLPSGWVFPDLDGRALVETVDNFYPATVANWSLESVGELDVAHWRETAERQTGIYDLIDELPRAAVEWVAEACCVDSQCTKRREWEYDVDDELAADGGDGPFPCREPCSVVIAAAREWTKLEREETQTYEFDLTPSEKEQVEDIIDAVADGRVDEIREADVSDGANRYRARYLRAKRFDEDGNLSGTPTDTE